MGRAERGTLRSEELTTIDMGKQLHSDGLLINLNASELERKAPGALSAK